MSNSFGGAVKLTIFGESHGEAIGAVLLLSKEQGAKMGDAELKVAETAAGIVGRQMEQ